MDVVFVAVDSACQRGKEASRGVLTKIAPELASQRRSKLETDAPAAAGSA